MGLMSRVGRQMMRRAPAALEMPLRKGSQAVDPMVALTLGSMPAAGVAGGALAGRDHLFRDERDMAAAQEERERKLREMYEQMRQMSAQTANLSEEFFRRNDESQYQRQGRRQTSGGY